MGSPHNNKNKYRERERETIVPYHKPRWPNYYSSFVMYDNVAPRALPMPGLNLSRKMEIPIRENTCIFIINHKSPSPPIHATSFLSCFNQSFSLLYWIQMHVFVYFFLQNSNLSWLLHLSIILLRGLVSCALPWWCLSYWFTFPYNTSMLYRGGHTQSNHGLFQLTQIHVPYILIFPKFPFMKILLIYSFQNLIN